MTRWHSAEAVRIRAARQRFIKTHWDKRAQEVWLGYRNHYKRKPGDCGQVHCHICHWAKYWDKASPSYREWAGKLRFAEGLAEVGL
jgi:hypothetical protein